MAQVTVVQAGQGARQRRRHRRPQNPFHIRSRPFEITPFMIHPVLPNETLDNLLFQADAYSDPIVSRVIGWHANYQFYYVPHMALANENLGAPYTSYEISELHTSSLSDITGAGAGVLGGVNAPTYGFKGAVPWLEACMEVIVNHFYRDEGTQAAYSSQIASGMEYPLAWVNQRSWIHSLKEESKTGDDEELAGVDPIEEQDILTGYTTHFDQWEIMRDSGQDDLSYDDYLRAQGVRLGRGESYANLNAGTNLAVENTYPELLRFVRKWVKPVNAIDPTDGSAVNAIRWNCSERADKKRYFKEPGFIVGVACTTPKIYLGNQKGSIVGLLKKADHWLPKVLQGYGYTSVTEVLDSVTDGPLINQDEDYWFDLGDLFNYGDQFVNYTMAAGNHGLAIPDGNPLNKLYLSEAEIKTLFVDSTNDQHIYQDGTVHLDILTTVPADSTAGAN